MIKRKGGRNHGEVFTKLNVVNYLLDEVNYLATENLQHLKILEPAAGQGVFAVEIVKRLALSAVRFNFDFITAFNNNVRFVELDNANFKSLKNTILDCIEAHHFSRELIKNEVFLNADYLQISFDLTFDCIVGNPPYIRHELIPDDQKIIYKTIYKTFKYRADLYVLFYEKSLNLLSEKGILSFICSNRWLFNQYGSELRGMIAKEFHLAKIINIEKANVFDESVVAYPCISTIKKSKGTSTKYYESQEKIIHIHQLEFNQVDTPKNSAWQNLFLDYDINHDDLMPIIEQGFEIGIGVATGADKVFIKKSNDLNGIEKSRLLPIIKSNALKGNTIKWDNSYVLNPFENGELCDLNDFPHLKEYLIENKSTLEQRYIAKKNPKHWYKTIDKINPNLQSQFKLLLPDLAGSQFLFIDKGNYYPHHNVYYITHTNLNTLKILACILMSDFIKDQLSQIGIRMNGGLPRFQAQALKKLRIPNIENLTNMDKSQLISAYDRQDFDVMNLVIEGYCERCLVG